MKTRYQKNRRHQRERTHGEQRNKDKPALMSCRGGYIRETEPRAGLQRAFSVLDRLLLTHPVWLQLSLNQDSALYILLREPIGTFLVRKCSSSQRKVLCLRVTADRSASSVKECFICEEDSNLALERAMFSCILRPLKCPLEKALTAFHNQDGSTQLLTQNMLRLKGNGAMERLGVRTGVPDIREVERVKQKLILMQRTHSPIDKVLLLLQVCKFVHKAMGTLHEDVSWDDFLPALSYVIVECNRPQLLIEVEYMMELLEPSWLGGEGGYYLTSVYASLCLIQSLEQDPPFSGCLTPQVQDALKEWSSRRTLEAQKQKETQQSQVGTLILHAINFTDTVQPYHTVRLVANFLSKESQLIASSLWLCRIHSSCMSLWQQNLLHFVIASSLIPQIEHSGKVERKTSF
uniref:Si:ch211-168d1.3 n=1 Tax=Cyprinodon variegatus TaxID=28743 RepID=A0A3Q2CZM9_CYPVA